MGFFKDLGRRFKEDPLRGAEKLGNKVADITTFGYRKKISDKLFPDEELPELPPVPQEEDPQEAARRIALTQAYIGDVFRRRQIEQGFTQGFQSQVVAGQSPALTYGNASPGLGDILGGNI